MPDPSVSIIICTYNRERFLRDAVRSALAQTHRDLEVILWDDGSTDGSRAIIDNLAARDPRLRPFFAPNAGRARALNQAHTHARGRYIGWLDSDDLLANTAVEDTLHSLRANPALGMVYTHHLMIDEAGKPLGLGQRALIPYSKDRLLIDFMTFEFRLYKREIFDAVGGLDESFTAASDYDFCLKVSEQFEIACVPKPLYLYRRHADTISAARRLDQIESAARAIRSALHRRGLADKFQLDVEIVGRYALRPIPKPTQNPPAKPENPQNPH